MKFNCGQKIVWNYVFFTKYGGAKSNKKGIFLGYIKKKENSSRDEFSEDETKRALVYLYGNVVASKVNVVDLIADNIIKLY